MEFRAIDSKLLEKVLRIEPPGPQTMVTISSDNLNNLKKQLSEAKAWKRKAIKLLRGL